MIERIGVVPRVLARPRNGTGFSVPGNQQFRGEKRLVTATICSTIPRVVPVATSDYPFITENGAILRHIEVLYETWGELNAARDNAVVILHALTGDSHVASHGPGDREGWWEALIGPGKAIDTNRFFVLCANILGSCYGTTGPRSINPDTGLRYNTSFPYITVRDLVEVQMRLIDLLGIQTVHAVIGGSLGGMQAIEWSVMYPERVRRSIPIAATARFSAQGIAFNEVQRRAIMLDPEWLGGDYPEGGGPKQGMALARMVGMITYQSDELMTQRFGRNPVARYTAWPEFLTRFDVEGYLHYQGDKLARRFDANTYLYLSRAMDSQDVGRGRGSYEEGLSRITASTLLIGVRTDVLFPAYLVREVADDLARAGGTVRYEEIDTPNGHDAFLNAFERQSILIREFLEEGTSFPLTYPTNQQSREGVIVQESDV